MEIARLPPSLFDAAIVLWDEAALTRPWNDPVADLQRAMDGPTSTILAACGGGKLVGTVMVGHDGHRGWVYYLAVRARDRGRGIGSNLMRASEAWLAERDVPKLNLMVRSSNTEVQRFYGDLGYIDDEVIVLSRRLSHR